MTRDDNDAEQRSLEGKSRLPLFLEAGKARDRYDLSLSLLAWHRR